MNGQGTFAAVSGPGEKPHVVVLHDDARVLPVLARYVEGYRFVFTATPDDALTLVRETTPAAVIVDTDLAGQSFPQAALTNLRTLAPTLICRLPSLSRLGLLLGATDYLIKPVSREDLIAALGRLARPPETVLLIDDDPGFIRLLVRVLRSSVPSLRILEASGAREGLDIIQAQHPDLVLLDLLMPGMSGYEVLSEMHNDPRHAHTDVIVMSARDLDEEVPPVAGELHFSYPAGFAVTQLSQCIQTLLAVITAPGSVARDSARSWRADQPVAPA